jgi:hypothetical protein
MSAINEIMWAIGHHGDDCIRSDDAASESFEALRELITAALAEARREGAEQMREDCAAEAKSALDAHYSTLGLQTHCLLAGLDMTIRALPLPTGPRQAAQTVSVEIDREHGGLTFPTGSPQIDGTPIAIVSPRQAVRLTEGPSTAAPTVGHAPAVDEPDPQWLHAEGIMVREVLAFDTGREIGKRGLKRFSAEMLVTLAAVLRNVRSEQDADNIRAELLRGFDAGRDECGNTPTIPPKGAGKVGAKYRNPEDGAEAVRCD